MRPIAFAPTSFYGASLHQVGRLFHQVARLDAFAVDAAIAVALTVLTQFEIGASDPAAHAALLLTLSLAFRRRAPLAVALLAAAAAAAQGRWPRIRHRSSASTSRSRSPSTRSPPKQLSGRR